MKTVLCYGDSNTWGFRPDNHERYGEDARWPGLLRRKLGAGFTVEEEGLNGRTTSFEDQIERGRSGYDYVNVCMITNKPVDIAVVMLGTNDLKIFFQNTAFAISKGLELVIKEIKKPEYGVSGEPPRILIVSPPEVGANIGDTWLGGLFDERSHKESHELAAHFKRVAEDNGCEFMDASKIVKPSRIDCLHMDEAAHAALADAVYEKLKTML